MIGIYLFLSAYNELINTWDQSLACLVLCRKMTAYFFSSHERHTRVGGETKPRAAADGLVSTNVSASPVRIQRRRSRQEKAGREEDSRSSPTTVILRAGGNKKHPHVSLHSTRLHLPSTYPDSDGLPSFHGSSSSAVTPFCKTSLFERLKAE